MEIQILGVLFVIILISLFSPNICYIIHKRFFVWREDVVKSSIIFESSGDWISVNQSHPEDDELKLVWFAKATYFPDITVGRYQLAWWDGERWGNTKSDDIENNHDYMVVTHWKVLVEPKLVDHK